MKKSTQLKDLTSRVFGKDQFIPFIALFKMQEEMGRKVKVPKSLINAAKSDDDKNLLNVFKFEAKKINTDELHKVFIKQLMFGNKGGRDFRSKAPWTTLPIKTTWCHRDNDLLLRYKTDVAIDWCERNVLSFPSAPPLLISVA